MNTQAAVVLWFALLLAGGEAGVRPRAAERVPDDVERATAPAADAPDVKNIVRTLEARYHSAANWKANFLERYSEGRRDVRVESGTVYFSRPGRMRWEYEAPEQKLFIVDGKTVWFYVPADRTVTRAPMKKSADWRTPLALLTRKARLGSFCGRIERVQQSAASGHIVLRCLPKGAASDTPRDAQELNTALQPEGDTFREVLLEVHAERGELARVLIRRAGGIEIEYRFGNWQRDLPLAEALFHFQAPRGVAIVDERSLGASAP